MTAKEYLQQLPYFRQMIRRTENQIAEIRALAESTGAIRYDKVRVQTSPVDTLAEYAARLEEVEQDALRIKARYYVIYNTIQQQIDAVLPDKYRVILAMRYLDGLPLRKIANELSYTYEYTINLHGKALQQFAKMYLAKK